MKPLSFRLACATLLSALCFNHLPSAQAVPYASGITNNAGTISWVLNQTATDVQIVFNNGTVTNDLGSGASVGVNTFTLAPYTNFSIVVSNIGASALTQISSDSTAQNQFFGPRGVTVNTNAAGPFFGWVYVANASPGSAGGRATTKGIYAMDAASDDVLNKGSTAAVPANMVFSSSTTYDPFKLGIGIDNAVYVGSGGLGTGNQGGIWMCDPTLAKATNIFGLAEPYTNYTVSGKATNFGEFVGEICVSGTLASSNLTVSALAWYLDICNTPTLGTYASANTMYNQFYEYNIGHGPLPFKSAPTVVTNPISIGTVNTVLLDATIAPDGKVFVCSDRSTGHDGNTNMCVLSSTGTLLWDSKTQSKSVFNDSSNDHCWADVTNGGYGDTSISISPDDKFVVIGGGNNNIFILMALTNGVPDMATITTNTTVSASGGATGYGTGWDAADNIYVTSGGSETLRVFALPRNSVATTSNDGTITNGTFKLQLMDPAINTSPLAQSLPAGTNATFTVSANGTTPLTYQWYFDGALIAGQTASTLVRTNVQVSTYAGNYQAVVTNVFGAVTSLVAELTVVDGGPTITLQPVAQAVNAGSAFTKLTVAALGTATLTYQWQLNGTNIPGATTTSFTPPDPQDSDAGNYQVLVANPYGTVTSQIATLSVTDGQPAVTTQPVANLTVNAGSNAAMSVVTTGTDPRSYQWYYVSGPTPIPGATNASYTITNAQSSQSTAYEVIITNAFGSTTSSSLNLTVTDVPSVTFSAAGQPKSTTAAAGANVTFTASAYGDAPIGYQWSINNTPYLNATNSTFIWTNAQVSDTGKSFFVVVTNATTSITSTNAVLTVTNGKPSIVVQPTNFSGVVGGSAFNNVAAQGGNPLSFYWYTNLVNATNLLASQTSSNIVLTGLNSASVGNYYVVVSNTLGMATSSVAILAVTTNTPAIGTGTGVNGDYYFNTYWAAVPGTPYPVDPFSFTNSPSTFSRLDPNVYFTNFLTDPTVATNPPNYFVARWTGQVQPLYSENYTFYSLSDDGMRLWVNDQLVLDHWVSGGTQNYSVVVSNMVAGDMYDLRAEYMNITGSAYMEVSWSSPSQIKQPIPTSQLYTNTGPYVLMLTPAVTNSVVMSGGSSTNLTAIVGGTAPISYQWTMAGTNIPGATTSSLTLNNVHATDAGTYNVLVSNSYGAITSAVPVLVTVEIASTNGTGTGLTGDYYSNTPQVANTVMVLDGAPTLVRLDPTVDFNFGTAPPDPSISQANFTVVWSGQIQPLYSQDYTFYLKTDDGGQLWVDNQLVVSKWANQSVTETAGVMPYSFNAGQLYNVVIEYYQDNAQAQAHLSWASASQPKLAIQTSQLYPTCGPTLTVEPASVTNVVGNNATFNITAIGTATVGYQWQKNGINLTNGGNISGSLTTNLTVSAIGLSDAASYSCVATNGLGSTASSNAVLTVTGGPPTITSQPTNLIVNQGATATFTVGSVGTPTPTFQWLFNSGTITNATNSVLTLTNVQPSEVGSYSVIVTNNLGGIVSSNATLEIDPLLITSASYGAGNPSSLSFSWTGTYTLQTSTNILGPWADLTNAPATIAIGTNAAQFYRLRQ